MAYRLRYEVFMDWVGPGQGPMAGGLVPLAGFEAGGAQTLELFNTPGGQNTPGNGTAGAITTGEITTVTNAMAADIAAQLNKPAVLAQIQGFATGGL